MPCILHRAVEVDLLSLGLLTGEWGGVDPLVLAVFNSLGIFPLVFLTILLRNDRYRWPAWPFALVSMGAGAFALLPYFSFGDKGNERSIRTPRWLLSFFRSNFWLYILLATFLANGLLLLQGFSLAAYGELFRTSSLVSVMTVDWFVLWGLSVYAMYRFYPDAQKKRLAFVPIIGPVLVLLLNGKYLNDQG